MKRTPKRISRKPEVVAVGNVRVKVYARQRATTIGGTRIVYEVADYTSGIRRLRGFTDPQAARGEAERIARQLSTGNAVAANMNNGEAASYARQVGPSGRGCDELVARLEPNALPAAMDRARAATQTQGCTQDLRCGPSNTADLASKHPRAHTLASP